MNAQGGQGSDESDVKVESSTRDSQAPVRPIQRRYAYAAIANTPTEILALMIRHRVDVEHKMFHVKHWES